jgi:hypothetical protein
MDGLKAVPFVYLRVIYGTAEHPCPSYKAFFRTLFQLMYGLKPVPTFPHIRRCVSGAYPDGRP